jgi:hypothetical protein
MNAWMSGGGGFFFLFEISALPAVSSQPAFLSPFLSLPVNFFG